MKRKILSQINFFIGLCILYLFIPACNSPSVNSDKNNDNLKGEITISGAFALYPLTVKWAEEFQKIHPKVSINISAGGAGKGMADALSKMVDLGMFSKEVSPEEKAKGAWYVAVAKDAVLPTVNSSNPVIKDLKAHGLTKQKFFDIFITGKIKTWGEATGTASNLGLEAFTRSDACGAAEMWAKFLKGKKQEDLQGLGVNGDPGIADAIRNNICGIGYNILNFVYDMETRNPYYGIDVLPFDLIGNGLFDPEENFYTNLDQVMNAIRNGIYPSPPARDLYFVSEGKPGNKIVLQFLNWVLTDGQKYLAEAGYVPVSPEKIKADFDKLNSP
ncbi:MAG: substrate-binding domain-containing protein [Bacteroidales bacterium]